MITTRNRCYFPSGSCNNTYFSKETSNNLSYIKDFDVISTLDMAAKSFLFFMLLNLFRMLLIHEIKN